MIPYFSRNWVAPPEQNSTRTGAVLFCGDARKYDFHILVLERIFLSKHVGINSEPFERNSAGDVICAVSIDHLFAQRVALWPPFLTENRLLKLKIFVIGIVIAYRITLSYSKYIKPIKMHVLYRRHGLTECMPFRSSVTSYVIGA